MQRGRCRGRRVCSEQVDELEEDQSARRYRRRASRTARARMRQAGYAAGLRRPPRWRPSGRTGCSRTGIGIATSARSNAAGPPQPPKPSATRTSTRFGTPLENPSRSAGAAMSCGSVTRRAAGAEGGGERDEVDVQVAQVHAGGQFGLAEGDQAFLDDAVAAVVGDDMGDRQAVVRGGPQAWMPCMAAPSPTSAAIGRPGSAMLMPTAPERRSRPPLASP